MEILVDGTQGRVFKGIGKGNYSDNFINAEGYILIFFPSKFYLDAIIDDKQMTFYRDHW